MISLSRGPEVGKAVPHRSQMNEQLYLGDGEKCLSKLPQFKASLREKLEDLKPRDYQGTYLDNLLLKRSADGTA